MRISIAQVTASEEKEKNLEKARKYAKKAKDNGSNIVVFPEVFMVFVPATSDVKLAEVAETLDGTFVKEICAIAKENDLYIIFGMYEKNPDELERAYNTIVSIDRNGDIIHSYRKTHLYDAFITKESNRVVPGTEDFGVVETEFGKIGLMICYEVRFPEIARKLTLQGADVIIIPTAWVKGEMKEEHWSTLLQARAIENTTYVVGANQIGNIFSGLSMIYDPMGVRIASAGEEETLISADVDLERIKRVREKLPCLENRRPEFY